MADASVDSICFTLTFLLKLTANGGEIRETWALALWFLASDDLGVTECGYQRKASDDIAEQSGKEEL